MLSKNGYSAKWKGYLILLAVLLTAFLQKTDIFANGLDTQKTKQEYKPGSPKLEKPIATSKAAVKLRWKKVKDAEKYIIYRSKSAKGKFIKLKATKKTSFTDKTGKPKKTYYYKISAVSRDPQTKKAAEGKESKARKVEVRKKVKKNAYIGDSIMTGFNIYHITGRQEKVFAKTGINASGFYGSDLYKKMLQYNPDRLFLMLGMNCLGGKPSDVLMDNQIEYIGKIIKACRKKNPDIELVVMGVSPVSYSASVKKDSVVKFNKKLKKSVKKEDVHYYNTGMALADSKGYLKSGYGGGDGIHWSKSAYKKVYQSLQNYIKEW